MFKTTTSVSFTFEKSQGVVYVPKSIQNSNHPCKYYLILIYKIAKNLHSFSPNFSNLPEIYNEQNFTLLYTNYQNLHPLNTILHSNTLHHDLQNRLRPFCKFNDFALLRLPFYKINQYWSDHSYNKWRYANNCSPSIPLSISNPIK